MSSVVDPRHLTLSEKLFLRMYPSATPILDWCDFQCNDAFIDVKECIKNSWGRYHFFVDYHDKLVDEGGFYFFVLKRRVPNSNPRILQVKWVPALAINYDEAMIEQYQSSRRGYEIVETFRVAWRKIWPELLNGAKNGTRS